MGQYSDNRCPLPSRWLPEAAARGLLQYLGMILIRGVAVWLIIMLAETLHGVARVLVLQPYVGDFRARQIGVFTGSLMIVAIAVACIRWIRAAGLGELFAVGLLWLLLTLCFEVLLGRFVLGLSWERIASDYNLLEGGLLPIGLFVLTISPFLAAKIRGGRTADLAR